MPLEPQIDIDYSLELFAATTRLLREAHSLTRVLLFDEWRSALDPIDDRSAARSVLPQACPAGQATTVADQTRHVLHSAKTPGTDPGSRDDRDLVKPRSRQEHVMGVLANRLHRGERTDRLC